jgi:hypothetical protein
VQRLVLAIVKRRYAGIVPGIVQIVVADLPFALLTHDSRTRALLANAELLTESRLLVDEVVIEELRGRQSRSSPLLDEGGHGKSVARGWPALGHTTLYMFSEPQANCSEELCETAIRLRTVSQRIREPRLPQPRSPQEPRHLSAVPGAPVTAPDASARLYEVTIAAPINGVLFSIQCLTATHTATDAITASSAAEGAVLMIDLGCQHWTDARF